MNIKLLVVDVDGTLLNEQRALTQRTIATIKKVQQMGVKVAIASGRPTHGLVRIAMNLDLPLYGGYVIAYNGAKVTSAADQKVLMRRSIDPEQLTFLEEKAKKIGCSLLTYHNGKIVTNNPAHPRVQMEAAINNMKVEYVEDFAIMVDFQPTEVVLIGDDQEAMDALDNKWQRKLAGTNSVLTSGPGFLEVQGKGVDKSSAVAVLTKLLGITNDEVMAIGDGVADVGMLQSAKISVAMGNAPESVRRCADNITLSNTEDGCAAAIEKFILTEIQQSVIPLDSLNEQAATTLMGNLGIQYTYADPQRVEATMPVDQRTRQPFGILHGGATLALAETVAGLGSMIACPPECFVVGMQVSGNHISSAIEGDTVRAVATAVHLGRSSHVWNVDVFTSTGKLVSSVRVVNSVMLKK
ncbi:MAG: Cof-type HAD-IIB family hydrolase [Bacteroidaceae bacterium]|nr:Cof-type HAD-IIB family hydrolase [Bacteroidaceae bacterium]